MVAGAGAGKTRTLVDRCLAWIKQGGSVDQMLMVTFTLAAAAEMRQRLRAGLESAGLPSERLAEQSALLDTAHICTLHSFCFRVVSEHFYELGLDPQLKILPEEESRLLASQTLDALFEEIYQSREPAALEIQQLILAQGADGDRPVRELIGRIHRYAQTLRNAAEWMTAQRARFESTGPAEWQAWLMKELQQWRAHWRTALLRQPAQNVIAAACRAHLDNLPEPPSRAGYARALAAILDADKLAWPRPKARYRDPIKEIFEEAEFLHSVCAVAKQDPLAEDWDWARASMLALLDAAERFTRAFAEAKRQAGGIDFNDLEQFTLQLLWERGRPSAVARQWRKILHLVFVDEFQDINGAQEAIIEALARDGAEANRFLVGDVKQSIYRFRLADPGIFIRYKEQWSAAAGAAVLGLSENFRSHESILDFVNTVFTALMREEAGGLSYSPAEHLQFGAAEQRPGLAAASAAVPPVEWHLHACGKTEECEDDEADSASNAEKEARLVGRRLIELRAEAEWSDMVILLRSPRAKTEAYVKEFNRLGIPLAASRGGFYDALEITDLVSILQVLDNPLQDLPLLAVLRSSLGGFTPADLATVRAAHPRGRFWTAVADWPKASTAGELANKTALFLQRFRRWRRLARNAGVGPCLEHILDETCHRERLLAQDRGPHRQANVERFLQMARQFDTVRGESLSRFVRLIQAQQESEAMAESAAPPPSGAVRLMSIHQSKGLEFPIVVLADLAKRFNLSDLNARIILDEKFGLSPQIRPPDLARYYPSLPWWLARRRQRRELLGEEMRLLYVAMTRAMRRLILCATVPQKQIEEKWPARAAEGVGAAEILAAGSCMDWLGPWLKSQPDPTPLFRCIVYRDDHPALAKPEAPAPESTRDPEFHDISAETQRQMAWKYPARIETRQAAKLSVSRLRRQITGEEGEAALFFRFDAAPPAGRLSAAEIGSAHHLFLQRLDLQKALDVGVLAAEAERLRQEGILTQEQAEALDLTGLAAFWASPLGGQLLRHAASIRRELAFTARFSGADLARAGSTGFQAAAEDEFVIVQGAIDIGVFLPGEIWLVDLKTDHFAAAELNEKIELYRPQLALYADAISRIHQRPVTQRWLHFLSRRHTAAV